MLVLVSFLVDTMSISWHIHWLNVSDYIDVSADTKC